MIRLLVMTSICSLRIGLGRLVSLSGFNCTQYIVQCVYYFGGSLWRKRNAISDIYTGRIAVFWCLVHPIWHDFGCAQRETYCGCLQTLFQLVCRHKFQKFLGYRQSADHDVDQSFFSSIGFHAAIPVKYAQTLADGGSREQVCRTRIYIPTELKERHGRHRTINIDIWCEAVAGRLPFGE